LRWRSVGRRWRTGTAVVLLQDGLPWLVLRGETSVISAAGIRIRLPTPPEGAIPPRFAGSVARVVVYPSGAQLFDFAR
jgi:hypothetical protein